MLSIMSFGTVYYFLQMNLLYNIDMILFYILYSYFYSKYYYSIIPLEFPTYKFDGAIFYTFTYYVNH